MQRSVDDLCQRPTDARHVREIVYGRRLHAAHPAPWALSTERETRERLRAALGKLPSDTVLLIGDTDLERGWMATGRLAGYVPADRFFAGI